MGLISRVSSRTYRFLMSSDSEPPQKFPKLAMISTLNSKTDFQKTLSSQESQNLQNQQNSDNPLITQTPKNKQQNSSESTNIPHADILCTEPNFIKNILAERKQQENFKSKTTQKLPNKRKRATTTRKNTSLQIVSFKLDPINTSLLQRYASLPSELLRERVLQLYDIAHQLSVQEEHEIAKGRYLEILKR